VPFASPVDDLWVKTVVATKEPTQANLAALTAAKTIAKGKPKSRYPNHAFRCVMKVFRDEHVGLVVRLNNDL
jgi:cell division cycle 14